MGKETFSFDIVSEVDLQEVDNAVNQATKELAQRFDFKGSVFEIKYDKAEKKLTLVAEGDLKLQSLRQTLTTRLVKRNVSPKALTFKDPTSVFGGNLQQIVELANGIQKDRAKELVKIVKDFNPKVQVQIEGEKLRVSSAKKDDLQGVITHLRGVDLPIAVNFVNYR